MKRIDHWQDGLVGERCLSSNFSSLLGFGVWFFLGFFEDRVSLCSPGYPGGCFVDQAGLKLRDPPASASPALGLKACATSRLLLSSFNDLAGVQSAGPTGWKVGPALKIVL